MTLISITASSSGPYATRQGDLIIPGTEVAFGGFSSVIGYTSTSSQKPDETGRDVYMIGMTAGGLQLARAGVSDLNKFSKYQFWEPQNLKFSNTPPKLDEKDYRKIYLPGTFSSGSVFYSPYFHTFVMVYFNKLVDSTFRIRYLDLNNSVGTDSIWPKGGKNGQGIVPEDAEALVKYAWSPEQELYKSPPGKGGFNYAGVAHPEYFNRQYFATSLYPDNFSPKDRRNDWLGSSTVSEKAAGVDGKHLLLSWTSQVKGGLNAGIYKVQLAKVEFDDVPQGSDFPPPAVASSATGMPTLSFVSSTVSTILPTPAPPISSSHSSDPQKPSDIALTGTGSQDRLNSLVGKEWRGRNDTGMTLWQLIFWLGIVRIGMFLT